MRKIIDAISIASFAISLTMAIGGGYVYMKRVDFMNHMMLTLQDQMIDIIQHQIKMPNVTGLRCHLSNERIFFTWTPRNRADF